MTQNTETFILKIVCPDQKGLIAETTAVLSRAGANILDLTQHSATDINTFFLRALFECESSAQTLIKESISHLADLFAMNWEIHSTAKSKRIALFASKTDHCLYELLLGQRDNDLSCTFTCIISNHHHHESLASQFHLPFFFVSSEQPKKEQENRFRAILAETSSEGIVLARYMQILSAEFTREWENQIVNIHHGFLPAFKGAKPYHQAWAKGVKLIGATAHFANEDLDQGPIIWQSVQQIQDSCSIEQFIRIGKDVEKRTLSHAVKLWTENRIFIYNNRTFIL
ncbi:MAG: formyltetrahydrofolate deformylase [Fibrobacter sp.]|nr:formyltetrahydrofolate deformylase [Fibrobacter sp.]